MRRLAALSLLAIVGAAACGGDDNGGSESTTGGASASTTTAGGAEPTTGVTDSTAAGDTATDGTGTDGTTGGGGSVADSEEAYVDALMTDYSGNEEDAARCIAGALIGGVGLEQLQSKDVSPEELAQSGGFQELDLTVDDKAATEQAVAACGDGYLVLSLFSVEDTPEARACADEHLSDEVIARVVVASSTGEDPSQEDQDAANAFDECMQGN